MRYATDEAVERARKEHAAVDFVTEPERLARLWNIQIVPGTRNRANYGPPSVITRDRHHYAPRQRFTMHHEFAHFLLQRFKLQDDIKAEVDEDDSDAHLERVADYIASILVMPDPLIISALERYRLTPAAVVDVRRAARVSYAAAMRRVAYSNVDQPTTVFINGETYIVDVASTDPYNRLRPFDRVIEPAILYENATLMKLPNDRIMGIMTW